jgi:hypothetical protein
MIEENMMGKHAKIAPAMFRYKFNNDYHTAMPMLQFRLISDQAKAAIGNINLILQIYVRRMRFRKWEGTGECVCGAYKASTWRGSI